MVKWLLAAAARQVSFISLPLYTALRQRGRQLTALCGQIGGAAAGWAPRRAASECWTWRSAGGRPASPAAPLLPLKKLVLFMKRIGISPAGAGLERGLLLGRRRAAGAAPTAAGRKGLLEKADRYAPQLYSPRRSPRALKAARLPGEVQRVLREEALLARGLRRRLDPRHEQLHGHVLRRPVLKVAIGTRHEPVRIPLCQR